MTAPENTMNVYEAMHFTAWLVRTVPEDEQAVVKARILSLLRDYPTLLNDHSWPEIRALAERRTP